MKILRDITARLAIIEDSVVGTTQLMSVGALLMLLLTSAREQLGLQLHFRQSRESIVKRLELRILHAGLGQYQAIGKRTR
jgi:hypothetical protein